MMSFDKYDAHRKKQGTVADVLLDSDRARMALKEKKTKYPTDWLYSVERARDNSSFLYLLPSELELATAVKNPQGVEFRLSKALEAWAKYFDFTFIDCAPTDTVLTATALMASQFTLVPIRPDRFSVLGYGLMGKVLQKFREDYPDPNRVKDLGVVFTLVSRDPNPIEEACKASIKKDASYVFKAEIPESDSYLRSVQEASPVFDTRYARQITRTSIDRLVGEIEQRIQVMAVRP